MSATPAKPPEENLTIHAVRRKRIEWIKQMFSSKGKGLSQHDHVKFVENEFHIPLITAFTLYADAMQEMGDTSFSKEQFDLLAVNDLMIALKNPFLPPNERRRMWEAIAKFKGYFKQTEAPALPSPANLTDPAVMEAALALDQAIEKAKEQHE